jgi:hypothetical protein
MFHRPHTLTIVPALKNHYTSDTDYLIGKNDAGALLPIGLFVDAGWLMTPTQPRHTALVPRAGLVFEVPDGAAGVPA